MKKFTLSVAIFLAVFAISCKKVEKVDPDFATQIAGTYVMKTYVTQDGPSSPGPNDKILISKISDKNVEVTVDYASPDSPDVVANNVSIVKDGDKYTLSQSFSNAELTGTVNGASLEYNLVYNDDRYAKITADKQ